MQIEGWRYYNHAAVPSTQPHENPDLRPIEDGSIWKMDGSPLLARWTTDFDCGYETNWWYVIKDTPFDISCLKAKRRYEINKGNKNFCVKEIAPREWVEEIYNVAIAAYKTYPKSYRPNIVHDDFVASISEWNFYKVYGAFSLQDESLCGYACLTKPYENGSYINFTIMKSIPEQEKLGLNAAIVNKILTDHNDFLGAGGYINDGARSIQHETAFQDYLEKYFGFRKAYCKLSILYKRKMSLIINILYPFRGILHRIKSIAVVRKVEALLRMEEIYRAQKRRDKTCRN